MKLSRRGPEGRHRLQLRRQFRSALALDRFFALSPIFLSLIFLSSMALREQPNVRRIFASPTHYYPYFFNSTGNSSIFAANIKSFSLSPLIACVVSSIATLR